MKLDKKTHFDFAVFHDLVEVVVGAEDEGVDVGHNHRPDGERGDRGEKRGDGFRSKVHWDGEDASVEIRVEGIVENVAVTMMTREKRQDKTSRSLTRLRMRILGNALAMVYT